MSDEEPATGIDWDDEAQRRVPYGELLDMVHLPPMLQEHLLANDGQKAFALNYLALPFIPDAPAALDTLLSDAHQLVAAADQIGKTPMREFAWRVLYDINDAIEAMFTFRGAPVMDACRDLMELTMLFRDFVGEPQRLGAWVRADADGRRRKFSFRFLVRKYKDDLLYVGAKDPVPLLREYQGHSRTIHPAMYFSNPDELTRGRLDDASQDFALFMIASNTTEIVRHGVAALVMLAVWMTQDNPNHPAMEQGDLAAADPNSAYDRWMAMWEQIRPRHDPDAEAEFNSLMDADEPMNNKKQDPLAKEV